MADLITSANFKTRHGITISTNDARIATHVSEASRDVQNRCGRSFDLVTVDTVASARYFHPDTCDTASVDDCTEITEVALDLDDSGTYATVLSGSDYFTTPLNGLGPGGLSGWPIEGLTLVGTTYRLLKFVRPSVKVTAKWGWAALPADVVGACYQIANRLYYEVSVPSGIDAPNVEFGVPGAPLQRQYTVDRLLKPYMRAMRAKRSIGIAG